MFLTFVSVSLFILVSKHTPYSTNSLFSEFFKGFSGVILGVLDTIWRLFGGHFGGVCEGFRGEDYSTSKRKNWKNCIFHY